MLPAINLCEATLASLSCTFSYQATFQCGIAVFLQYYFLLAISKTFII